jgi:alpha/beta superfamily hydrolase
MDIPGPAGALEAQLDRSPVASSRYAVLCHPHPQYGGSMHDAVLDTLAGALLAAGVSCLRFNFRGVGASEGRSSGGAAEAEDLLAAAAWLRAEQAPAALWLGGYSFGASMVWQAAASIDPERLLLVAPPVGLMQFSEQSLNARIDVFAGDRDDYVDFARLTALKGATVHQLAGADHFFMGCHDQLRQQIAAAIS